METKDLSFFSSVRPKNFFDIISKLIIIQKTLMLQLIPCFVFLKKSKAKKRFLEMQLPGFFINYKPY